jgi:hypothetical protein
MNGRSASWSVSPTGRSRNGVIWMSHDPPSSVNRKVGERSDCSSLMTKSKYGSSSAISDRCAASIARLTTTQTSSARMPNLTRERWFMFFASVHWQFSRRSGTLQRSRSAAGACAQAVQTKKNTQPPRIKKVGMK